MKPRLLHVVTLRRPRGAGVAPPARRMPWRPLSLCWRRAQSRAGAAPSGTAARPLRQAFHTQLHLHFAIVPGVAPRQASPAAPSHPMSPHVTVAHRTRIHHEHLQVHRHALQHARERVRHEQVSVFEQLPPRLVGAAAALPAPRRTLATATRQATAAPRRVLTACIQPVPARRPGARLVSVTPYPRVAASQARSESPPVRQRLAPASPGLVWLKPAAPGLATEPVPWRAGADTAPGVEGAAAVARVAGATPVSAEAVQASDIAREARRALLLDAAFTDRLADDVLRKVDKRVRIERERRGL